MRSKIIKSLGMYCVVVGLTFSVRGQSQQNKEYWFNSASSPLQVVVTHSLKSGQITESLDNKSDAAIIEFQLGCVKMIGDNLDVIYEEDAEKIKINPVFSGQSRLFLPKGSHGSALSICSYPAKVAVVAVRFADGAKWTIH